MLLLVFFLIPMSRVMAENGLVEPSTDRSGRTDREATADAPTRLLPQWTAPQRAPASVPALGKAVAAEMAHAEELGSQYGEIGSIVDPVDQAAMIDVVGAGVFISPIKDENHQIESEDELPLAEPSPETVATSVQKDDWTTEARIVVHSPDRDDRLPSKLNQLLLDFGAKSVEHYEVDVAVTSDHIRFYHPSDHMHAIEVAAALDGVLDTLLVKDFSFIRPQPDEGLVEIWLR